MTKQRIIAYALGSDFKEQEEFIRKNFHVIGVSDSNEEKGKNYTDFIKRQEICEYEFDNILICSEQYYDNICEELIDMGIRRNQLMGMQGNVYSAGRGDPIIVVRLMGGTGNLMFQYALAVHFMNCCPNTAVKVDITWYQMMENISFYRIPWVFETLFGVELPLADKEEIAESKRQNRYKEKTVGIYNQEIEEITGGFVDGYWQTSKYFSDINNQIRDQYRFNLRYMSDHQRAFAEQIGTVDNSAAVWIRGRDYLKYTEVYGGICTEEYYQNAMEYLRKKYGDVRFFIFSDDADYIREKYDRYPCMVYSEDSTEFFDYSIYLMSLCDHLIIANSTFSWWAAWLKTTRGTVICPQKWARSLQMSDILEDNWIRI